MSEVSDSAGSGRPYQGCRNVVATSWASVLLPPLPNVKSLPPAANLAAIASAHSAIRPAYSSATCSRSRTISSAFSSVDHRAEPSQVEGSRPAGDSSPVRGSRSVRVSWPGRPE